MEATRDQNHIPSWLGISSVDGVSLVRIALDSSTGRAKMEIGTSISAVITQGDHLALRDMNHVPCLGGVSNADASIFIPLSVNPATGAILAQTT